MVAHRRRHACILHSIWTPSASKFFFFYIHTMCQARYYYYGRSHCLVAKPCCVTRCNAPVNPTQRGSAPDSRAGKNGGGLLCFPGACVSGGPGLSSLSDFHFGSGFYKGPLPLFSEVIKCKRKEKRAPEEISSRYFFFFPSPSRQDIRDGNPHIYPETPDEG